MSSALTGRHIESSVAGERVRAFVPNPLPPKLPGKLTVDLAGGLQAAEMALARLDLAGGMIPSLDWFIYAFVRKEALLSSEIEGTQATLVDVLSYEQTGQAGTASIDDVEEVTNYVAAIHHALDQMHSHSDLPLSIRLLNDSHRILMQGVRGASKLPGEVRQSQNWVGGTRPGNAVFVPPPPAQLSALLSNLETYIHQEQNLPPLLRIALAHAQFETIHPYLDGNGRVGRMLIALLLDHWGLLDGPLLFLSVYLKRNQVEYYRLLGAVRTEGDWAGWFRFFLTGVEQVSQEATATARALYRQVSDDRHILLSSAGITVSAIQLFELLPKHPVVSMPLVTRLLDSTKPTANKAINLLKTAGVLVEVGKRRRDRVFSYQRYLKLLT